MLLRLPGLCGVGCRGYRVMLYKLGTRSAICTVAADQCLFRTQKFVPTSLDLQEYVDVACARELEKA